MKPDLHYSLAADMQTGQISIRREFDAPKALVWDWYAKSELLDRWFAPTLLTARTKTMDFRERGHRHFAMVEPDGKEHWSRFDYLEINPKDSYCARDAFSNSDGDICENVPISLWEVTFEDRSAHTVVQIVATYETVEAMQQVRDIGMEEGMKLTLNRLDKLLERLI